MEEALQGVKEEFFMKKKIILISSISIFALSGIIMLLILSNSAINAETVASKDKYVSATTGLNLRLGPDKSSKLISVIPFGTKVTVEKSEDKEIFLDGRYGKWMNIKYGNKTGWVFGGFLCDFEPDTIIKHATDYYMKKYNENELSSNSEESDEKISIKDILGNYIVLEVPPLYEDQSYSGNVAWRYDSEQKNFLKNLSLDLIILYFSFL